MRDLKLSNDSVPSFGRRFSQVLLVLLIAGLCVSNALLIRQNRQLKAIIAHNQPKLLEPGQVVTPFTANTLSGERRILNYSTSAKTVLLVFQPQCPACERSIPYWKEIKAACLRNQYQIFGLSLSDGSRSNAFLTSSGLNLETFVDIDAEIREAYKLNLTPITMVIDSNGQISKIWPGAFNESSKTQVEKYFGISVTDDVK